MEQVGLQTKKMERYNKFIPTIIRQLILSMMIGRSLDIFPTRNKATIKPKGKSVEESRRPRQQEGKD